MQRKRLAIPEGQRICVASARRRSENAYAIRLRFPHASPFQSDRRRNAGDNSNAVQERTASQRFQNFLRNPHRCPTTFKNACDTAKTSSENRLYMRKPALQRRISPRKRALIARQPPLSHHMQRIASLRRSAKRDDSGTLREAPWTERHRVRKRRRFLGDGVGRTGAHRERRKRQRGWKRSPMRALCRQRFRLCRCCWNRDGNAQMSRTASRA